MLIGAAIVFVALALLAFRVTMRAHAALGKEDKALLAEVTASAPAIFFLLTCVLLATWFGVASLAREYAAVAMCITLGLVLALMAASSVVSHRAHQAAGLPASFTRDFVIARGLYFVAGLVLLAVVCWVLFGNTRGS
jgi:uncharacterized membrane protein